MNYIQYKVIILKTEQKLNLVQRTFQTPTCKHQPVMKFAYTKILKKLL